MNILFLGGTRFFGVEAVRELLRAGHRVTIATRMRAPDAFGDRVERLQLDRTDAGSVARGLTGRSFDVVYDNTAYASNDVRRLLDVVTTHRYVLTSSASVYLEGGRDVSESAFDPLQYPLAWCERNGADYAEGKRRAEAAAFRNHPNLRCVAVRFPVVLGLHDYTQRLYFYAERIARRLPLHIDNLDRELAFISAPEAGRLLAFLSDANFDGPLNAASNGGVRLFAVVEYLERKCRRAALLSEVGEGAPFNGSPTLTLDTSRAQRLGFSFSETGSWLWKLLDIYVERVQREG